MLSSTFREAVGNGSLQEDEKAAMSHLLRIVIRRKDVKSHHLLADIGFQKTSSGYVAVIDDMDLDYRLGKNFVVRLQNHYHKAAGRKMAKKLGGRSSKSESEGPSRYVSNFNVEEE
jgi:hypothetical protein